MWPPGVLQLDLMILSRKKIIRCYVDLVSDLSVHGNRLLAYWRFDGIGRRESMTLGEGYSFTA